MIQPHFPRIVRILAVCTPMCLAACAGYESDGTVVADETTPTPDPVDGGTVTTTPGTTSDTNATGEYELTVKGMTPAGMMGKMVYAALLDANGIVIGNANTTAASAGFALSFPGKVDRNMSYAVAYFIDHNGNGFCNIADPNDPNADVGYMVNANNISNANTTVMADANATGNAYVCNSFGAYGFNISGTDFSPHNGQHVFMALMDKTDGSFVAGPAQEQILNGTFRFAFPSVMLSGHTYQAQYWIDQNHSDVCENHSWIYNMPAAPTGDTSATVTHGQAQAPVCQDFPQTLPPD